MRWASVLMRLTMEVDCLSNGVCANGVDDNEIDCVGGVVVLLGHIISGLRLVADLTVMIPMQSERYGFGWRRGDNL